MIKNKKGFTLIEIIIVIVIIGILTAVLAPNIIKSSASYQKKSFYDRVKVMYSASMFSYINLKEVGSIPTIPTTDADPNCVMFDHIYRNLGEIYKDKHVHSNTWADPNVRKKTDPTKPNPAIANPPTKDTRTYCMLDLGDAFLTLVQVGPYRKYAATQPPVADYEDRMYLQIYAESSKYKALYPAPASNDSTGGVVIDIKSPNPTWWAYGAE